MGRIFKQFLRRAQLNNLAAIHDNNLVGKGQGFDLIMGDINHGRTQLIVNFLELAAQNPFQMRIDHGQGFIKQDGRHIITHQTTAQRNGLLFIRAQTACFLFKLAGQIEHPGNFTHPFVNPFGVNTAIAQRKGKVFVNGHGVVNHRELENLCDVAFFRGQFGDILAIKQYLSFRRGQKAGNDVEQRGLATTRRAEKGISPTIFPNMFHATQRIIRIRFRIGEV